MEDGFLKVVECGLEQTSQKDLVKAKQANSKKYGHLKYGEALLKMGPKGEHSHSDFIPEDWRHQNQRPAKTARAAPATHIPATTIGAFKHFLRTPGPDTFVFTEHCEVGEHRVRIPLSVPIALALSQELSLTSFLLDFTFKTNEDG